MPLCPQITNTPITVTQTADFTVTSVLPVIANTQDGLATNFTNVSSQAQEAIDDANQALADAATAYALASTSLQKSANTITNASNQLTAINGNGITVYAGASPSSGARVVLNSAGIAGFNSGGSSTFSIDASNGNVSMSGALFSNGTISGGSLNINGNAIINSSGFLTATGATITGTITATSGSFTGSITSTSGTIGGFTLGATQIGDGSGTYMSTNGNMACNLMTIRAGSGATGLQLINGGNITMSGTLAMFGGTISMSGGTINLGTGGTIGATAGTINAGTFNVSGTSTFSAGSNFNSAATFNSTMFAPNLTTSTSAVNLRVATGVVGEIQETSASSQRFKENIVNVSIVDELDPKRLLNLPVRAFTYKDDYLDINDDRSGVIIPGFIAEEVDAIYPVAADYAEGQPHTWNERFLIPGLLALVQDLYKEIKQLKGE